jgi:hypothetical protein
VICAGVSASPVEQATTRPARLAGGGHCRRRQPEPRVPAGRTDSQ